MDNKNSPGLLLQRPWGARGQDQAVFFLSQQHQEHSTPFGTDTHPQQCSVGHWPVQSGHPLFHRRAAVTSTLQTQGNSQEHGTCSLQKKSASRPLGPLTLKQRKTCLELRLTVASSQRLEIHGRLACVSQVFVPPPPSSISGT